MHLLAHPHRDLWILMHLSVGLGAQRLPAPADHKPLTNTFSANRLRWLDAGWKQRLRNQHVT
jgi:hypothetical protein